MANIYLDIDGVLLHKDGSMPEGLDIFVDHITSKHTCYWLTTHCKGDKETALRYLARHLPLELINKLRAVRPTMWDTLKTEGIDLRSEFFWLEDSPLTAEKKRLEEAGKLDRLVVVDLNSSQELAKVWEKVRC